MGAGWVFSACGGAMMIARELFLRLGGFDERLFCYCEDVDLGYRLRLVGEPTLLVPDAVVRHVGSASTGGARSDFAVFHGTRNRFWVFVKDTPAVLFWLTLPLHIAATVVLFARHATRGEVAMPIKGLAAGIRHIGVALAARREAQATRTASTWEIARAKTWNPLDLLLRRAFIQPLSLSATRGERRPTPPVAHESHAAFHLSDLDKLVGLVGLLDGARSTEHGREAGALELPGLGGEGHGARRAIVSGQAAGEGLRGPIRLRGEGRDVRLHLDLDAGLRGAGLQRGVQRRDLGEEGRQDRLRIQRVRAAQVEQELAFPGQDVARGAAMDEADGQGRALRREGRGRVGVPLQPRGQVLQRGHQAHRLHDRRDPLLGLAGVGFAAGDRDAIVGDALVAVHRHHVGGLADHHEGGFRQLAIDDFDQVGRTQAADLLVVGKSQVHRSPRIGGDKVGHGSQRQGQEPLHVAGSAAIEPPIALDDGERVRGPGLAVHGHHVGVAGEHRAALDRRPDGGQQVRLGAIGVQDAAVRHAVAVQIGLDPGDQLQIGPPRGGVEADQGFEDFAGGKEVGHAQGIVARRGGSKESLPVLGNVMPDASSVTLRPARRDDVAAIVRLLADDALAAAREVVSDPPASGYLEAFERIAANPRTLLAVAEDAGGAVVGTLQLTFIPGLSNLGAELALVSAVRVDSRLRGQGIGETMMRWAMDEARRRGCRDIELLTHLSRVDAQRFYQRLGFVKSHAGMRRG